MSRLTRSQRRRRIAALRRRWLRVKRQCDNLSRQHNTVASNIPVASGVCMNLARCDTVLWAMTERILTIDGRQGEGGGQVLRSALTLSLVTGRPFVIEKIRGGRKKPGLLHQHLTAVRAAAEIGQAEVQGMELGSRHLTFRPGRVQAGSYAFRVGTAGSATLVLQTVLPPLLLAAGESNLVLEGGTHNSMAPPVDFLQKAYLPLVNRLGPQVEAQLRAAGLLSGRRRPVHRPRATGAATRPHGASRPRQGHCTARPSSVGPPAAAHRRTGMPDDLPGTRLGRSIVYDR